MIRVTKMDKKNRNDKPMVGTCENADCELEVECDKSDCREGQRGQDQATVFFIECPSCLRTLYVKEKE